MRISDWSSDVCSSDLTALRTRIPSWLRAFVRKPFPSFGAATKKDFAQRHKATTTEKKQQLSRLPCACRRAALAARRGKKKNGTSTLQTRPKMHRTACGHSRLYTSRTYINNTALMPR